MYRYTGSHLLSKRKYIKLEGNNRQGNFNASRVRCTLYIYPPSGSIVTPLLHKWHTDYSGGRVTLLLAE